MSYRAIFKAPRCAISSAKKNASERRFSLRLKGTNLIPTAEFPAIPESAAKIASERRCAILVHSAKQQLYHCQDAPNPPQWTVFLGEARHININFLLWSTSRWPWDKHLVVPGLTGSKKFMCSPRNPGNINFSLWLTGGLSQNVSRLSKSLCVQSLCAFFLP